MTLETRSFTVTRADLVAYAEASGDHNPIHQDEEVARSVGLPGVIAHGMFTMALAARAVADWFPGAEVVSFGCKFTAPVVVPAVGGVDVEVAGEAKEPAHVTVSAIVVRPSTGSLASPATSTSTPPAAGTTTGAVNLQPNDTTSAPGNQSATARAANAMVNMPWAITPGSPTLRATSSS